MQPSTGQRKRPLGLTLISIFWLLTGLWNIYAGLSTIFLDLEMLPYLDYAALHPWFRFAIPAEIAIAALVVILGVVQVVTIYGLWTGRPWSYKPALAIPILVTVSWWAGLALYLSAPASLELFSLTDLDRAIFSLFWVGVFWWYLRRPHVKEYLRVELGKEKKIEYNIPWMLCPNCKQKILEKTKICPNCGYILPGAKQEYP